MIHHDDYYNHNFFSIPIWNEKRRRRTLQTYFCDYSVLLLCVMYHIFIYVWCAWLYDEVNEKQVSMDDQENEQKVHNKILCKSVKHTERSKRGKICFFCTLYTHISLRIWECLRMRIWCRCLVAVHSLPRHTQSTIGLPFHPLAWPLIVGNTIKYTFYTLHTTPKSRLIYSYNKLSSILSLSGSIVIVVVFIVHLTLPGLADKKENYHHCTVTNQSCFFSTHLGLWWRWAHKHVAHIHTWHDIRQKLCISYWHEQ